MKRGFKSLSGQAALDSGLPMPCGTLAERSPICIDIYIRDPTLLATLNRRTLHNIALRMVARIAELKLHLSPPPSTDTGIV
jgi:hypothetical protein